MEIFYLHIKAMAKRYFILLFDKDIIVKKHFPPSFHWFHGFDVGFEQNKITFDVIKTAFLNNYNFNISTTANYGDNETSNIYGIIPIVLYIEIYEIGDLQFAEKEMFPSFNAIYFPYVNFHKIAYVTRTTRKRKYKYTLTSGISKPCAEFGYFFF
jgi:hypothetical protein